MLSKAKVRALDRAVIRLVTDFMVPVVTFVGIGDGVIAASLLSGLPATTCFAMAQTYQIAISYFGLSALLCVVTYVFGNVFLADQKNARAGAVPAPTIAGSLVLAIGASFSCIAALLVALEAGDAGMQNLGIAIDHCIPATGDREAASRERVPLYRFPIFWEGALPVD